MRSPIQRGKLDSLQSLPLLGLAFTLALGGGIGPNFQLAILSIVVLILALKLLWQPGESPILLFVVLLQWLQASIKIFHGNWVGRAIDELAERGGNMDMAALMSLLSLAALSVGMRVGRGNIITDLPESMRNTAVQIPQAIWFRWYLVSLVGSLIASELAGIFPPLSQPLLAVANLKWAFFFMLVYSAFAAEVNRSTRYWKIALGLEFLIGLGGFFSDFKSTFVFAMLGIVAADARVRLSRVALAASFAVLTVFLGIVWTAVKVDYRDFVNQGQREQIITVGYVERMSELGSLVTSIDSAKFSEAAQNLVDRLSYIDFFALTLDHVPSAVDHTYGAIWWDAITRPFLPRWMFPEKTAINDSERTNEFTGTRVAGADEGTSISIGYVGETYIDFGIGGMLPPLFIFGLLLGRTYCWLTVNGSMRGLLGTGLASSSLMTFSFMESSITKTLGGFAAILLVIWIFGRYIAPRYCPLLMAAPGTDVGRLDASRR